MNQATLGRLDIHPPEDLAVGVQKMNVFADALRSVLEKGVTEPKPSGTYHGEMPEQITLLDDEKLGDLLNNISQWCGFLEMEVAKASALEKQSEKQLDFVKSRLRIGMKFDTEGKKLAVKDKDDMVEVDPRVVDANAKYLYDNTVYSLTRVLRDKSQRDWETVSRRITQRGQAIDRARRDGNVQGMPSPAQLSRAFRRPDSQAR